MAKAYYLEELELLKIGMFHKAHISFCNALGLEPNFPEAHYHSGIALVNLGLYNQALGAYITSAVEYQKLGNFNESLQALNRALGLEPNLPQAHYLSGMALENLGLNDGALAAYNTSVVEYQKLGDLNESLKALNRALGLDFYNANTHCSKGFVFYSLGAFVLSIRSFNRALELSNDFIEAYCGIGLSLNKLGKYGEALGYFTKALELNKDYTEAHFGKGIALESLGRHTEAVNALENALERNSHFTIAYNMKISILEKLASTDNKGSPSGNNNDNYKNSTQSHTIDNPINDNLNQTPCHSESNHSGDESPAILGKHLNQCVTDLD